MANSGRMTTGSLPRALQYGVDDAVTHLNKVYNVIGEKLFSKADSHGKGFYESMTFAGMGEAARKGEGSAISYDTVDQESNTRWAIHTYVKAARLSMEAIDDNVYENILPRMAKEIAKSLVYTKDEKRASILNNAITSGETGPDGKVLIATDHPLQAGGTSANRAGTDADFSEDALEQMVILIDGFLNPDGLKSMYNPKYLVVPSALQFEACRVLDSKLRTGSANNDVNALNHKGIVDDYLVWKRLSDPDSWFVTTDAEDCLVEVNRKGLQRQEHTDPYTFDLIVSIYERYRMLFNDWRGIAGSFGA
jgi:hypothetical protein